MLPFTRLVFAILGANLLRGKLHRCSLGSTTTQYYGIGKTEVNLPELINY